MVENKSTGKTVAIVILILMVLGLGGYIAYDKLITNKNVSENTKPQESSRSAQEKFVKKIDDNKDWIYDAEYEYDLEKETYQTYWGDTQNVKDIKVPYINIDNMVINKINKEIKSVFNDAIEVYNEGIKDNGPIPTIKCNYKTNIINDIISVVLKYQLEGSGIIPTEYYTYNINTKTGDLITFEEAYEMLGYTEETINKKVIDKITSKVNDFKDYLQDSEIDGYMLANFNNYYRSVKEKHIKFFIDEDKKLNIVTNIYMPAENGITIEVITID